MAKRSLKALQTHLTEESNKSGGGNGGFYYPHWKLPKDGVTKIRITEDPDKENPLIVYVNYLEHKLQINEDWVRIPCLKNSGKEINCPICTHSYKLYKAKDEEAGKYFYREMFALLRGIIVVDGLEYTEDEEKQLGKERPFKFSYQLANTLKTEFGKLDEDEEFWSLTDGIDFEIVKQMIKGSNGKEYGKYDVGSGFVRRSSAVDFPTEVSEEPLSSLLPEIPSFDEASGILERYFKAILNGGSDSDSDKEEDRDALMKRISERRKEKEKEGSTSESQQADDASDVSDTSDAEEVKDASESSDDESSPLDSLDLSNDEPEDVDNILQQLKG